jgi:hypothetical protein
MTPLKQIQKQRRARQRTRCASGGERYTRDASPFAMQAFVADWLLRFFAKSGSE